MNKEVPKGVWITLVAAAVVAMGYGIWKVGFAGPGGMSAEDEQRAIMQAKINNQSMGRTVPQGIPGAPPGTASGKPPEMEAREWMQAGK